jgi:hypothetical protein
MMKQIPAAQGEILAHRKFRETIAAHEEPVQELRERLATVVDYFSDVVEEFPDHYDNGVVGSRPIVLDKLKVRAPPQAV